jgi:hypothetical protein
LIATIVAQHSSDVHNPEMIEIAGDEYPFDDFTKLTVASKIETSVQRHNEAPPELNDKRQRFETGALMVATGELIRSMNYVEDITATLRRICISIPSMTTEERQRLAESLRGVNVAITSALSDLEKVGK